MALFAPLKQIDSRMPRDPGTLIVPQITELFQYLINSYCNNIVHFQG